MPDKPHKLHGSFRQYRSGERSADRHEERAIAAVISGCIQLEVGGESLTLRPSDAFSIPAKAPYAVEATEESVVYVYADPDDPALWGV